MRNLLVMASEYLWIRCLAGCQLLALRFVDYLWRNLLIMVAGIIRLWIGGIFRLSRGQLVGYGLWDFEVRHIRIWRIGGRHDRWSGMRLEFILG